MKNIIFLLLIAAVACKKNNTSTEAVNTYQVTHAVQTAYYIDTVDTVFPSEQSFYVSSTGVMNNNFHFVKYGPSSVFAVETVYNKTTLQIGGYRAAFDIDSFYHYSGDTIAKKSIFVQQVLLIKEL